jgi:hypothetical protein
MNLWHRIIGREDWRTVSARIDGWACCARVRRTRRAILWLPANGEVEFASVIDDETGTADWPSPRLVFDGDFRFVSGEPE